MVTGGTEKQRNPARGPAPVSTMLHCHVASSDGMSNRMACAGWAGEAGVPRGVLLGAQSSPAPPPFHCASPTPPMAPHLHLSFFCSFVFHSLHCRLAASSPHRGRHYYFANKTCPACLARWVVWRDFLQTAVLIVAQDSCKLQSQRVALPAGEEPCPLHDLCLIIPCRPSWNPSLICTEGLVLPTSGQARQGENHVIWWWQGTDRPCKVGPAPLLVLTGNLTNTHADPPPEPPQTTACSVPGLQ